MFLLFILFFLRSGNHCTNLPLSFSPLFFVLISFLCSFDILGEGFVITSFNHPSTSLFVLSNLFTCIKHKICHLSCLISLGAVLRSNSNHKPNHCGSRLGARTHQTFFMLLLENLIFLYGDAEQIYIFSLWE